MGVFAYQKLLKIYIMKKERTYFILNRHDHYFILKGNVDLNGLKAEELASYLQSLLSMASISGLVDLDSTLQNTYPFDYDSVNNVWTTLDAKGRPLLMVTDNAEHCIDGSL